MPSASASGNRGFADSRPSLFDADEPFAEEGALPAGFSGGATNQAPRGYGGGSAAINPFDDDEGVGAYSFSGPSDVAYAGRYKRTRWQRFKEDHLTDVDWTFGVNKLLGRKSKFDGVPREVMLNDPEGNKVKGYEGNSVSTGKYGPITFLPKFLYCKLLSVLSTAADLISRILSICQLVLPVHGVYSAGAKCVAYWTVHNYRAFGCCVGCFGVQGNQGRSCAYLFVGGKLTSQKRHAQDRALNASQTQVLVNQQFLNRPWRQIRVGDTLRLEADSFIPADMVLISSSEPEGLAYVETANLDGETNLKIKQAHPSTANLTTPQAASLLRGHLLSEAPNSSLYTYDGTFHISSTQPGAAPTKIPVGPNQVLLRGAQLRNTDWVYGIVVNAGHQTKLMRNAT